MIEEWLGTTWEEAALVVVSATCIYLAVLTYTRLAGVRSFAKMSAFDFAMTVAVGSLMAGVATSPSATLANGVIALGVLYGLQVAIALLRRRHSLSRLIDNRPVLLVAHGRVRDEGLAAARMTRDDLHTKLRGAGLASVEEATAVVLETTGDVSVISSSLPSDLGAFAGVEGAEALSDRPA